MKSLKERLQEVTKGSIYYDGNEMNEKVQNEYDNLVSKMEEEANKGECFYIHDANISFKVQTLLRYEGIEISSARVKNGLAIKLSW